MRSTEGITVGAPGLYLERGVPVRRLAGVRMDVCAFVGVSPRGPARLPVVDEKWGNNRSCLDPNRPRQRTVAVPVESFDEYRRLYGGFEGPGLLPYAVASFFEQGGRRAYIARIVHKYADPLDDTGGVATGIITGIKGDALVLQARNEGAWGNRLQAQLRFSSRPVGTVLESAPTHLVLRNISEIKAGTLVRLTLAGGARVLRFVTLLVQEPQANGVMVWQALFDQPLGDSPIVTEIVEGELELNDGAGRIERHERVGLASYHPRWLARVLCEESELVLPAKEWSEVNLYPDSAELRQPAPSQLFKNGADRYPEIVPEDFFDEKWTVGDEEARDGVHALVGIADLSSVVVPDLYSPRPLDPIEPVLDPGSLAGSTFERCVVVQNEGPDQENPHQDLEGLRLDPRVQEELRRIIGLQQRLVELADLTREFVALLDVPPGLSQRHMLAWRTNFDTSYAAAYCPWVTVARRDDQRDTLIRVPPAAVAAGIMAKQELAFGVPHGPANVLAREVVSVDDLISASRHDELHPMGLNVYLREAEGVRLTAARTLSRDSTYRQLTVRRLVMMLRRTIEQRMQWVAFEPNHASLRADVRHHLEGLLQGLYRSGAFKGVREEEAFFVRCDEVLNPPRILDQGQLIVEIGIAPTEPIEFIILRLLRSGDGTLTLEE